MKITSINHFEIPTFQPLPQKNNYSYNRDSLQYDVFVKNNISFGGEENEGIQLSQIDKLFITTASMNLELTKEQQTILEKEVVNFLKEKDYETLDDIRLGDKTYPAMQLADNIVKKFELNEFRTGLLYNDLEERLQQKDKYFPTNRKYQLDMQYLKPVFEQYKLDDEIYEYMILDASKNKYSSLLDIFKEENNPKESKTYEYLSKKLNHDNFSDLMCELYDLAYVSKAEKEFTVCLDMNIIDTHNKITEEISNLYGIDPKAVLEYVETIEVPGITPIQIGFNIADKYHLPAGSTDEIVEIIKKYTSDEYRYNP